MSEKEQKVLAALQLNADLSISSIKKFTGLRDATIHLCLNSLLSRKVIRRYVAIDTSRLGYAETSLYCSLAEGGEEIESEWLHHVSLFPEVMTVWKIGGNFRYLLMLLTKSSQELEQIYNRLTIPGSSFSRKTLLVRGMYRFYGRRYLAPAADNYLEMGRCESACKIDELDHKILILLGSDASSPHSAIAKELGIPQATLSYRIRRLTASKIIMGYVYSDAEHFDSLIFMLLIASKDSGKEFEDALHKFCMSQTMVTSMGSWIGVWDYRLMIDVTDVRMLRQLITDLYAALGDRIAEVQDVLVLQKYKTSLYLSYPTGCGTPQMKSAAIQATCHER